MRGRNSNASAAKLLAVLAPVFLAAACATSGPPTATATVDFLRGCWVEKDAPSGAIQAFLRLLPGGADGNELNYSGEIQGATLGKPGQSRGGLSFARDGSSASWWVYFGGHSSDQDVSVIPGSAHDNFQRISAPTRRAGQNKYYAVFKSIYVPDGTLVVEATAERLKVTRNTVETIFDGERDGCD